VGRAPNQGTQDAKSIGITGGIVLLVILFLADYCGGYVAGRMARFSEARQGGGFDVGPVPGGRPSPTAAPTRLQA
jgi:hypothetical protein